MATTLDEVWTLFREVAESQKDTDRQMKETDRKFQESREEARAEAERRKRELDQRFQETDRLFKDTQQEIKALSKRLGELGGKWGLFVENLVAPACETIFAARGIPVHTVAQRVRRRLDGDEMEIDVLVVNAGHVVAVEVKSSLSVADVNEFMADLARFRRFFPEYAEKQLYGTVAGMAIEEASDRYAYRQGLFVLAPMGENVRVLNDAQFQPKAW